MCCAERNGRLTNAALAARAGIAESTCTQRLRSLAALRETSTTSLWITPASPTTLVKAPRPMICAPSFLAMSAAASKRR